MMVRTTRSINLAGGLNGIRVPGGRELSVRKVERGMAVVMFHGKELPLNPRDLDIVE